MRVMRRTRRVLLLAIVLILSGVGGSYYIQKNRLAALAPKPPKPLPDNVQASNLDWCHYMGEGDNPKAEICAREMEVADGPSSKVRLRHVELKLFHKGGQVFDRVRSASAGPRNSRGLFGPPANCGCSWRTGSGRRALRARMIDSARS